jgi:hypothetical protein
MKCKKCGATMAPFSPSSGSPWSSFSKLMPLYSCKCGFVIGQVGPSSVRGQDWRSQEWDEKIGREERGNG